MRRVGEFSNKLEQSVNKEIFTDNKLGPIMDL